MPSCLSISKKSVQLRFPCLFYKRFILFLPYNFLSETFSWNFCQFTKLIIKITSLSRNTARTLAAILHPMYLHVKSLLLPAVISEDCENIEGAEPSTLCSFSFQYFAFQLPNSLWGQFNEKSNLLRNKNLFKPQPFTRPYISKPLTYNSSSPIFSF